MGGRTGRRRRAARSQAAGVAAARRVVVDGGTSSPSRPCRETRCANERACALDVNEETAPVRSATGPAEEEAHARVAARVAAVDRRLIDRDAV